MKFYYVYMLLCSDGSVYTGLTNNLDRRFQEHSIGRNKECYTYPLRPLKLIWYQEFMQFSQAEFYEKSIKKWSRAKKLALADDNFDLLHELSKCKNETNSENKGIETKKE